MSFYNKDEVVEDLIDNTPMNGARFKRCPLCKGGFESFYCILAEDKPRNMYPCTTVHQLICPKLSR